MKFSHLVAGFSLCAAVAISPAASANAEAAQVQPAQIVVRIRSGIDVNVLAALVDAVPVRPLISSRGVYLIATTEVFAADKIDKSATHLADVLSHDRRVIWAEATGSDTFDDERFHAWPFAEPVAVDQAVQANQAAFAHLHLAEAQVLATGRGVVVAVLDTGVDTSHPLLAGHVRTGYDMVDDDGDPSEWRNGIDDDHDGVIDRGFGHGTFVAGMVRQVAPDATIMPVRVLDDEGRASTHTIVEGINYAVEQGADVINLSLGVQSRRESKSLASALANARAAGVVVVAAAGNNGDDVRRYPAAGKDVVAVGALSASGKRLAAFSCRGKWVDVAAPGVGLVSSMPGGGYAQWGGSSMSAPIVSAQLAMIIEHDPGLAPAQLEHIVWKSSLKLAKPGGVEQGSVDLLQSLT